MRVEVEVAVPGWIEDWIGVKKFSFLSSNRHIP